MRRGLSQSLGMRQELKINPRLYQAMDLLYMPLLDLQQHLKQEMMANPFLELAEPIDDEEDEQEKEEEKDEDEIDWEEILLNGFETGGYRDCTADEAGCDRPPQPLPQNGARRHSPRSHGTQTNGQKQQERQGDSGPIEERSPNGNLIARECLHDEGVHGSEQNGERQDGEQQIVGEDEALARYE